MFDSLTSKLQSAFKNLRGLGKISESNISDALREVRMALLEADVNFKVARDFIERVKTKSIGQYFEHAVARNRHVVLGKLLQDREQHILLAQRGGILDLQLFSES